MNISFTKKQELLAFLLQFISDNKKNKFDEFIKHRTKHLTVVIENIFQSHNASAVLRTCDCVGVQDVHIIEKGNSFKPNSEIAFGASKWLNIQKHNTVDCLVELKSKGYKIIATMPNENCKFIDELDLTQKSALVFGQEKDGLSQEAIKYCDEFAKIRMYGFTESYNISVAAAICLYQLTEKLRNSSIRWQLSEDDLLDTKLLWAKNAINDSDKLVKRFFL
ncbi:MAG: RNA methyltransferase [Bacteroidales bacterium]|nr:RNA methyltransferase [Bacteroidales bacterium]